MEAGASAGAAAGAGDDGRSGIEDTTAPSVLMEATAADRSRAHIRGYLRKLNRKQQWQKRFFEVVDHFFVYYKREDAADMLCAMDLYQADPPRLLAGAPGPDGRPEPSPTFCINYDRDRMFKASSPSDAERWVGILLAVQRANPAHAKAAMAASSTRTDRHDERASGGGGDVGVRDSSRPAPPDRDTNASPGGCCVVM